MLKEYSIGRGRLGPQLRLTASNDGRSSGGLGGSSGGDEAVATNNRTVKRVVTTQTSSTTVRLMVSAAVYVATARTLQDIWRLASSL